MSIYIYDGTFEGFLTTAAVAEEKGGIPEAITREGQVQQALFSEIVAVETDQSVCSALCDRIACRISTHSLRRIYQAFHSETEGVEMALFRYLQFGWRLGRRIDGMLAHELVHPVRRLADMVKREAHRMRGFVRFKQVREGFYYAPVETSANVLPFIAGHFADRFSDQHWIIHDIRREKAIIHDAARREWGVAALGIVVEPSLTAEEEFFQDLWKRYFTGIAIKERSNLPLQKKNIPLKYRKYLVEMAEGF